MSNTEQKEQKPDFIDKVYFDSRSGDEISIRKYLCHRCNQYMSGDKGHPSCIKEAEQERKMEENRLQREEDIRMFGEVIHSDRERYMRLNPDARDTYTNKSWNMMLAEKEQAKKDAIAEEHRRRIDRRERQLPAAESHYRALKAQVQRDIEQEKAEEESRHTRNSRNNGNSVSSL